MPMTPKAGVKGRRDLDPWLGADATGAEGPRGCSSQLCCFILISRSWRDAAASNCMDAWAFLRTRDSKPVYTSAYSQAIDVHLNWFPERQGLRKPMPMPFDLANAAHLYRGHAIMMSSTFGPKHSLPLTFPFPLRLEKGISVIICKAKHGGQASTAGKGRLVAVVCVGTASCSLSCPISFARSVHARHLSQHRHHSA